MKSINAMPLDNAGKIYPAAMNKKWNAVFGVSAVMKEEINVTVLKNAVKDLAPRYPSMYVKLKSLFFWDSFTPATNYDIVEKESQCPCRPMVMKDTNKPLFRVVYNKNRIRVEFSHCVTDGTGALEYLKSLLFCYIKNKNGSLSGCLKVKTVDEKPKEEELRDDFLRIYEKGNRMSRADDNAYQIELEKEDNYLSQKEICLNIEELKAYLKSNYDCTVTQYIATVYALSLLAQYKIDENNTKKKNVKLSIPVNLRSYFNSTTLRNFASYITINVTPSNEYSFTNVLSLVKSGMKEKITKINLFKSVCQNVADEKMIIARYSPNKIKKLFMKAAFHLYGERKYTSTVTSVGYVTLPQAIEDEVDFISCTLGETSLNMINCAAVGFKNTLCVNISSISRDEDIQNFFIDYVKKSNLPVSISSSFEKSKTKTA